MQSALPLAHTNRLRLPGIGWTALAVQLACLGALVVGPLWSIWRSDASLSHGPLVPVIAGVLLWSKRDRFRQWDSACPGGLALTAGTALVFVCALWADIAFLKPLSLAALVGGIVWYLGGWSAFRAAVGPLGFLAFMAPWPTTLVDRIGFPLQLMSSSYAAMLGGLCGISIHREGVQLAVMPDSGTNPIYSILVAQKCSGLTSLTVLLALGYLIAYFTEIPNLWRALMVAAVVPIALLTNSVRLTFILLAGAHSSAHLARWVHDHEGPVLIFFCSMGLLAIRSALLYGFELRAAARSGTAASSSRSAAPAPTGAEPVIAIPGVEESHGALSPDHR